MDQVRVLTVDDHAIVRKSIQILLNTDSTIRVVGEANDGSEAVSQVKELQPDVVLMDLVMAKQNGIDATKYIKKHYPDIKVIILTTFEDETIVTSALKAGADGYMLKDADGEALIKAIHAAIEGKMPLHPSVTGYLLNGQKKNKYFQDNSQLTEREREILTLVAEGWSNKKIAESLNLAESTIKFHVSHILRKLDVANRTDAAVKATEMRMISTNGGTRIYSFD
ncbi:MAG: response regulator transcription factor [Anaerolineae bacterium]|nr:response regulator transcription factor [Anaerolineae bacterium]